MYLTLVGVFNIYFSTLLPYYQTLVSRHFNLREVRKSEIILSIFLRPNDGIKLKSAEVGFSDFMKHLSP